MNISNYQSYIESLFNNNIYPMQTNNFPKEIYNNKLELIHNIYNTKLKRDKSYILVSYRTEGYTLKNQIILEFIDNILTNGLYSKLYKVLRKKHNLIYSINSIIDLYKYKGAFNIHTSTNHKNIKELTKLLLLEINKIYKNGFTINDLKSSRNKMILYYNLIKNDAHDFTDIIIQNYINTNKIVNIDKIIKLIKDITINDINKYFKTVFNRSNLYIAYYSPETI